MRLLAPAGELGRQPAALHFLARPVDFVLFPHPETIERWCLGLVLVGVVGLLAAQRWRWSAIPSLAVILMLGALAVRATIAPMHAPAEAIAAAGAAMNWLLGAIALALLLTAFGVLRRRGRDDAG